jgi:MFS family permease
MLKQRIYRLWLPGILTMTVAMVILYAGVLAGRQPGMMKISPKISVFMYLAWLLILPALGALAGYWSRRAGGSVANRAAAALFTAVTMLAICLMVLILEVFAHHGMMASGIFMVLLSNTIGGILIGGMLLLAVALLAGAWPFLRDTRRAALFTALTMPAIYLVVLIHAVFADDHMKASSIFMALGGILLPAAALLIGALPFLRESAPQRQAADNDPRVGTA